jgi:hypothetical protein
MQTQEKAARSFRDQNHLLERRASKDERAYALLLALSMQALPFVPAQLTDKSLSFAAHTAVWLGALLGVLSPQLSGTARTVALLSAGACAGISVLGESLRAARSSQSDAFGALRAHWLGSLAVPLTCAGMSAALELPAWAIALVMVATCTFYNAKVVHYYQADKPARIAISSSVETQLVLAVSYITVAALFCWIDRHAAWVDIAVITAALTATFLQLRGNMGYFPKLGHLRRAHLAYSSLCSVLAVLYVTGAIHLHHFLLCSVFTSFRISGTYALRAFSHVWWSGTDRWLVSFVIGMAITHLVSISHSPAIPITHWLAVGICCYACIANLIDFSRHYPSLSLKIESAHL